MLLSDVKLYSCLWVIGKYLFDFKPLNAPIWLDDD